MVSLISLIKKFNMLKKHDGVLIGISLSSWDIYTTIDSRFSYANNRHNRMYLFQATWVLFGELCFVINVIIMSLNLHFL